MKKSELRQLIIEEIKKVIKEKNKKMSIVGMTKFVNVNEGTITFANDSNIVKWFKQFNEEDNEIIFDNNIAKQLQKMLGVKVEEQFNDYWDDAYSRYLWFYVDNESMSDTEISKKLKGQSFKAKFKAE